MYIYLDESGTLTGGAGDYFIVASFTVGDIRKIAKEFRKWQKNKLPKKLKVKPEVKFNDNINNTLRLKTLKHFANQDIRIFYTFLKKKNIPLEYYKKGKVHETGLLYTEIVKSTLGLYIPITDKQVFVIRDRRTLKGVTVEQFNDTIIASLLPNLPAKVVFQIQAVDSTSSAQVQIADWICGALAHYYEGKPMGKEFYAVLKGNIVQEKELFSEKWTKVWEK